MVGKTAGSNNDKDSGGGSGGGIDDTCYTGFTVRAPEYARKCRAVGGRRYRPARTPGMRVNLRSGVSPVSDVSEISETTSPPPPASGYGAMKSVGVALAGGVLAFAIALDFASIFAATLATFAATLVICAWFGVAPTIAPADGIGIDKALPQLARRATGPVAEWLVGVEPVATELATGATAGVATGEDGADGRT